MRQKRNRTSTNDASHISLISHRLSSSFLPLRFLGRNVCRIHTVACPIKPFASPVPASSLDEILHRTLPVFGARSSQPSTHSRLSSPLQLSITSTPSMNAHTTQPTFCSRPWVFSSSWPDQAKGRARCETPSDRPDDLPPCLSVLEPRPGSIQRGTPHSPRRRGEMSSR